MQTHALIALALAVASTATAAGYALADLEALQKQSSWEELINHAEDIPPSQRAEQWNALVEEAATNYLGGLDVEKLALGGLTVADGLTRRYPTLKLSKPFMQKRADVGLRGFARCFELTVEPSDRDMCGNRLQGFSDGDPTNLDLARRAATLLAKAQARPAAAVPFFYRLIGKKKNAAECSDEGAQRSVVAALDLPKDDPRVAMATEIASQLCWDQMQNKLVDEVISERRGPGHFYFENSCGFLVDKKALGTLQTNRCKALSR